MTIVNFVTRHLNERTNIIFSSLHVTFVRNISRKISKNHYAVLNIHPKASKEEIRTAYLELSKKLHPDKNLTIKDTHSRFLEIQEAYSILSNEESRKIYDSSFKSKDAIFDEEQMDKEMTNTMNHDEQRMYSEWRGSKSSRRSRSKQHFRVEMEGSTSQPHQFVLQITVFMVFIIASISFANRVLDYRRDNNLAQILKDGFEK